MVRLRRKFVKDARAASRPPAGPPTGLGGGLSVHPKPRRIKCNAPWARRFVPGNLPPSTLLISLACPPMRSVWVGRYKNVDLQRQGLRPTRSNKFGSEGSTSEHAAFQLVLDWLWTRHERATGCRPRPPCVQEILAPCAQCAVGKDCSVLDVERAAFSKDVDMDDDEAASDWSGEGSSESMSSDPGTVDLSLPLPAPSLPLALLVGDSNARGYCETHRASLHQALSAHYCVRLAAKSGAKWNSLSENAHAALNNFAALGRTRRASGEAIAKERAYRFIFAVLGTNDIPTLGSRL